MTFMFATCVFSCTFQVNLNILVACTGVEVDVKILSRSTVSINTSSSMSQESNGGRVLNLEGTGQASPVNFSFENLRPILHDLEINELSGLTDNNNFVVMAHNLKFNLIWALAIWAGQGNLELFHIINLESANNVISGFVTLSVKGERDEPRSAKMPRMRGGQMMGLGINFSINNSTSIFLEISIEKHVPWFIQIEGQANISFSMIEAMDAAGVLAE